MVFDLKKKSMEELVYIFPFTVSRKKEEKNVARV